MLRIDRSPIYRNKFMLSSLAVVSGFLITFGAIRALNPVDTTTNQSAQPSSEERATLITPINSSESESGAESDKNDRTASASQKTDTTEASTPGSTSNGTWTTSTASPSTYSPQPTGTTWSQPSPTPVQSSSSPSSTTPTSSSPSSSGSTGSPTEPSCTVNLLGIRICL